MRVSAPGTLRFLAVRGVFPRILPGVLKTFPMSLLELVDEKEDGEVGCLHIALAEDLSHVLVEPFELMLGRESDFFSLIL